LLFTRNKILWIRRSDESKHFLTVGNSGVGKSTYIRQLLRYAQRCGDICVVLDSKLEFIPEFYDPRRGDKILSPKDERCIWWDLGNEVTDLADALTVSESMYPTQGEGNYNGKWFDEHALKIAAHLLVNSKPRPSCEQFGHWLTNFEQEIRPRLKGTEHEHTLNPAASHQYGGIVGTLNQVGTALRMMPRDSERDYRERFTIREWARHPQGWLFLPNQSATRKALKPLQAGWADMCISRIMSSPQKERRVWIVLDELDSIGILSKLHEGMTQLRSFGHPMVLGIHSPEQLHAKYGSLSETIFSQAFTQMIFATSGDKSSKTLQDMIGEVEIRRFRESRTASLFGGKDRNNFSGPEDVRKPLVMASEIQGLPDLMAYFLQRPSDEKVGLHVVRVSIPWEHPVWKHQPIVERIIPDTYQPVDEQPKPEPNTPPPAPQNWTGAPIALADPTNGTNQPQVTIPEPAAWLSSTRPNLKTPQKPDSKKPKGEAAPSLF
jgi:hypothetical protein